MDKIMSKMHDLNAINQILERAMESRKDNGDKNLHDIFEEHQKALRLFRQEIIDEYWRQEDTKPR